MSLKESARIGLYLAALGMLACQPEDEEARPGGIDIGGPPGPVATPQNPDDDDTPTVMDGTLEGVVVQFLTDSFDSTTAFPGSAQLSISSNPTSAAVETTYDGADFVAEGAVLGTRWIYVEPDDETAFPTITRHEFGEDEATVPVVARTVLDDLFLNITTPVEFNRARAHLLLRVVDSGDNGVAGVTAAAFAASVPVIAYKEGAIWPEYLDATTGDGLAFVPNLEAPAYPGQLVTVVLTGAIDEEIEVLLALGTITVITVVAP